MQLTNPWRGEEGEAEAFRLARLACNVLVHLSLHPNPFPILPPGVIANIIATSIEEEGWFAARPCRLLFLILRSK
jgi:hypothetical protein